MTKLKRQNQKIRISIIIVLLASMLFVSSSQALTDNKQMPATSMENLFPAFMNVSDETGSQVASRSYDLDGYKNTIGYNNQDGTKTVYIYSTDVRYRDKNGVLRDKDTSIVSTQDTLKKQGYSYQTKANNINTYFPDALQDKGIKVAYKQNSITLKPYSANGNEQNTMDDSKAIYTGVYGKDDKLVYTPILDGLRSDIIVNDATVNEFSFISDFGSYVPELQNGEIVLQSNEESQLVLKTLQATDAEGSISDQVALSLKSQEDGTYLTTLAVDDAFLESSDTVYPVTVSATLTMSTTSSSGITTASVYEDSPTSNYGSETYNGVGVNSTRGNAYTYVKFNLSALSNIRYDNILSAHYDTYELTGSFAYTAVESYIAASTWSESTITWQNKPDYYSDEKVSTVNIGISVGTDTSEPYSMYITSAVQAWRQGLPNNGLVLKSRTDTGVWKQLPSDENTSKPPCLVVTYATDAELTQALGVNSSTMYYLVNKNSGKYVTAKSLISIP